MGSSKHGFLVTMTIVLIFVGNTITSEYNKNLVVMELIGHIQKQGSDCLFEGISQSAVIATMESLTITIRTVVGAGHHTKKAIDKALSLVTNDPEGAISTIKNGIKYDTENVFFADIPIFIAQGYALALGGDDELQRELNKNILISLRTAETAVLKRLDVAGKIAIQGIKAGGISAEYRLAEAHLAIGNIAWEAYVHLLESLHQTFMILRYAAMKKRDESNLTFVVLNKLTNNISNVNSECLSAIGRLKYSFQLASVVLSEKPAKDAATILTQGLISTISETANAMELAKKALKMAGTLDSQNIEMAVDAVQKAIKQVKRDVITSSASGYSGLGAAGQIYGKTTTKALRMVFYIMKNGVVKAYIDFKLAERRAIIGLRSGGSAAADGISAAIKICESAANELYTHYADGGEIGFAIFRKLEKIM